MCVVNEYVPTFFSLKVDVKKQTISFKKAEMGAKEYYEKVLVVAFGDELPEVLPKILQALPTERASALASVAEVIKTPRTEARRDHVLVRNYSPYNQPVQCTVDNTKLELREVCRARQ